MKTQPRQFNEEEKSLEEMVETTEGVLVICLSEVYHPGSEVMEERVRSLMAEIKGLQFLSLSHTTYRRWASYHRIHGTPALLIFSNGRVVNRLRGLVEEETLRDIFGELR